VADGRPKVIVAESTVASVFVVVAGVAVANTRWWRRSAWSLTGLPRHSSALRSSPG
jgi:hypothetical protein